MAEGVVIRRFRREDEDGALQLLVSKVAPERRAAAEAERRVRWKWQYYGNPANPEADPILWVAEAGNSLVGLVCPLAANLRTPAGLVGASWCNDWIVDRGQRGTGLGWALEDAWVKTFPVALGRGWSDRAYAVSVKLGLVTVSGFSRAWIVLSRVGMATLLLRARQYRRFRALAMLPPRLAHRKRLSGVSIEVLPALPSDAGEIWSRVAGKYRFSIERSLEHLRWRYGQHPTQRHSFLRATVAGEAVGLAVVRVSTDDPAVGVICDLLVDPSSQPLAATLLADALRTLKSAGACAAVADFPPALEGAFRAAGGPMFVEEVKILVGDNARAYGDSGIYDSRSWYLSKADSDIDFNDSVME